MILSTLFQMNELFLKYRKFSKPLSPMSVERTFFLPPTLLNSYILSNFGNNFIHPIWKSYTVAQSSYWQANFMPSLLWSLFRFALQKPSHPSTSCYQKTSQNSKCQERPKIFLPICQEICFFQKSSELNNSNLNTSWLLWIVHYENRVCVW